VKWPSWFAIVTMCNLCNCVYVELSVIIVSVIQCDLSQVGQ
jgi:hypothetical protein